MEASPKFTCSSANLEITCTGVADLGSSCTADRDNTGAGQEAYQFIAIDGAGNAIYSFTSAVPVGFIGPIGAFPWSSPPLFNPIRLRFISLAGNGFPEQVVLDITGPVRDCRSDRSACSRRVRSRLTRGRRLRSCWPWSG